MQNHMVTNQANTAVVNAAIESGATETVGLIEARAGTSAELLNQFKEKNTGMIAKMTNRKNAQLITKSEIDIILAEYHSQKNELDAIHVGRLKSLQKVIEQKLMFMNTTLHVELVKAYKQQESVLLRVLDDSELEFQNLIEAFESRINSYRNEAMKQRALENLNAQVANFYNSKEKLMNEYSNLIENLKFPSSGV